MYFAKTFYLGFQLLYKMAEGNQYVEFQLMYSRIIFWFDSKILWVIRTEEQNNKHNSLIWCLDYLLLFDFNKKSHVHILFVELQKYFGGQTKKNLFWSHNMGSKHKNRRSKKLFVLILRPFLSSVLVWAGIRSTQRAESSNS